MLLPEDPPRIQVSDLDFSSREYEHVLDALNGRRLTQGPKVAAFEREFSRLTGVEHTVACNSGTSALHLALLALGVGPGDAVIVPALSYVATANAARYVGADVWFCDVRVDDWTLDTDKANALADYLHDELGYKRVVVIPVHLYDARADYSWSHRWITVIADSAHDPLASNHNVVASAHSFFSSKIIACGEGGAVTTYDPGLAARIRLFRGQGAPTPGVYHHTVVGYNYRMPELAAAVGLGQLERVKEFVAKRRAIINHYRAELSILTVARGVNIEFQDGERASGWMFAVFVPDGVSVPAVRAHLDRDGIGTRPFFEPLNTLPPYQSPLMSKIRENERFGISINLCPVAESLYRRGICLPTHTLLTLSDVDRVCERLLNAVECELKSGGER